MDGRGYGSGFSSWGGGSRDPMGVKMNQQLRMYHQPEGGTRGARNDRFEQYGPRHSHRHGGYGYGDPWGDRDPYGGPGYGGGPGWGPGQRGGGRPGRWQDPHMPGGGGRGGGGGGSGKVPLLPDPCMYPERGYKPPAAAFAGYHMANREFNPLRPPKRQRDGQRKRKKALAAANAAKMSKTEGEDDDKGAPEEKHEEKEPEEKIEPEVEGDDEEEEKDDEAPAAESKPEAEGESADSSTADGTPSKSKKAKKDGDKPPPNGPSSRAMSLVTFACSVCKFRSCYGDDMAEHLKSKFHREHFRYLASQMTKPTSDFLQAYLTNKYEKADQRVKRMEDYSGTVCKLMRDMDLSRGIGMEHFMKKVEALYCAACDMYVPMQPTFIEMHLKSSDHNYNRKGLLEYSKRVGCSTARGILSHKYISTKHQSFIKGEDPFSSNADEQDHEDPAAPEGAQGEPEHKAADAPEEAGPSGEGGAEEEEEALGNGGEKEGGEPMKMGEEEEEEDDEEEEDFEDEDEDEEEEEEEEDDV